MKSNAALLCIQKVDCIVIDYFVEMYSSKTNLDISFKLERCIMNKFFRNVSKFKTYYHFQFSSWNHCEIWICSVSYPYNIYVWYIFIYCMQWLIENSSFVNGAGLLASVLPARQSLRHERSWTAGKRSLNLSPEWTGRPLPTSAHTTALVTKYKYPNQSTGLGKHGLRHPGKFLENLWHALWCMERFISFC